MHFCYAFGKELRAAHSICTRVGPKHRDPCMSNWNVTLLNGKKQELVWEAEQYHLDIVEVSSTKCRGSDTVELNECLKHFYLGVDVAMSAQAGCHRLYFGILEDQLNKIIRIPRLK